MKHRVVFLVCCLAVLAVVPSQLFADQFCTDLPPFQYQHCGTMAAWNVFTVNQLGASSGVSIDFRDYHANFVDSVQARVFRNGQVVFTSAISPSNENFPPYSSFPLIPPIQFQLQVGDEVELVFVVADVNGPRSYYSREADKGLNIDGANHTWATTLPSQGWCNPKGLNTPCIFVGFEDLSIQEGGDFDYNDFAAWLYGVDFTTQLDDPTSDR